MNSSKKTASVVLLWPFMIFIFENRTDYACRLYAVCIMADYFTARSGTRVPRMARKNRPWEGLEGRMWDSIGMHGVLYMVSYRIFMKVGFFAVICSGFVMGRFVSFSWMGDNTQCYFICNIIRYLSGYWLIWRSIGALEVNQWVGWLCGNAHTIHNRTIGHERRHQGTKLTGASA